MGAAHDLASVRQPSARQAGERIQDEHHPRVLPQQLAWPFRDAARGDDPMGMTTSFDGSDAANHQNRGSTSCPTKAARLWTTSRSTGVKGSVWQ